MPGRKRCLIYAIYSVFGFMPMAAPTMAQTYILNSLTDPPHVIAYSSRTHGDVTASAIVSVVPDRARASATEPPWTLYFVYALPAEAQNATGQRGSNARIDHHVIRRLDGQGMQILREQWADSRQCRPLTATLGWLSRIVSPGLDIDGITPRREPIGAPPWELGLHPPTVTVWASTWTTHGSVQHQRIQESGGALGAWLQSTTRHLADCWLSEEPS